jgi:purine-nucleoside/S-methyl-5'-thioadenosine phosphorylase / adenosine deaminase
MTPPSAPPRAAPLLRAAALSRVLGVVHGFTTRLGGVSEGPLRSLNLARRPGEQEGRLRENWRRVGAALLPGLGAERMALVDQVHGAQVLEATRPTGPLATLGPADALITTRPGVVLAVRTADCAPVLLAAPGGVAAIHAGWRGVAGGVVTAAVEALCARAHVDPSQVRAAVGPCIGPAAFEVGDEVLDALEPAVPLFERCLTRPGPRPHVDLARAIRHQLRAAGVGEVDVVAYCTAGRSELFSHRADGPDTGRQAAVIALAA